VVGIKPTHGLVPSFGITYLDHTIDFICPLARTVAEVAQALEVIAGDDPRDAQWVRGPIRVEPYVAGLDGPVHGLRLGVIREAMDLPVLEADVDAGVRRAIAALGGMGLAKQEVSVPFWPDGQAIWNGVAAHTISAMIESEQEGYGRRGLCDLGWVEAFANARRVASDGFPPVLKALMVLGKYLRRDYRSVYFAKATNLRFEACRQMDQAFAEFDLLVTATTPMKAFPLLSEPPGLRDMALRSASMCQNTYPLNVTGHPAVSMPVGLGEHGLPIGLQLIGRPFEEAQLLRVAHALEQRLGQGGGDA
jgi:amidase